MKPTKQTDLILAEDEMYHCPLYKTLQRQSLITNNGNNSHFIRFIHLKCADNQMPEHWILRGCALVCQLND